MSPSSVKGRTCVVPSELGNDALVIANVIVPFAGSTES